MQQQTKHRAHHDDLVTAQIKNSHLWCTLLVGVLGFGCGPLEEEVALEEGSHGDGLAECEVEGEGERDDRADDGGEGEGEDPGEGEGEGQNPGEGEGEGQNPGEGEGEGQNPGEGEGEGEDPGGPTDLDGDGFASPSDCDDNRAEVHPGATDVCGNNIDEDCQGGDEACTPCAEGAVHDTCTCAGVQRDAGFCCGGLWQSTSCGAATILWSDDIQGSASTWGFNGIQVERPVGSAVVSNNEALGVGLTRVVNPLGGGGYALRQLGTFDGGGSRSQAGIWSFANDAFSAQARSPEGVYIAQEWYFPEAIGAGGDYAPWLNLWDWHSTDAGGANRWHTSPGMMLHEDGSMRVRWEWGGPSGNPSSANSSIALPVGEWFDVEMHYQWSATGTTLQLWINGALALEQSGVRTRAPSHQNIETYVKWYGSDQGGHDWSPTPSVRYVRNVRMAATRITQ